MSYTLEDFKESGRLEKQNSQELYNIEEELAQVSFNDVESVLDAGCGTGFVTRNIIRLFPHLKITGVDLGIDRLNEAKKLTKSQNVNYIEGSLYELPFATNSFDLVISRFVFHHLDDHQKAMDELYRVVKPGGRVVIIDSDGILFNFYSHNTELMNLMKKLEDSFHLDFFSARKLKSMMSLSGAEHLNSTMTPMHFHGHNLILEREQYIERFEIMAETLANILGENDFSRFKDLFFDALDDEDGSKGTELYYSRFLTWGKKKSV